MAGPCAERVLLDRPCSDMLMKASRVRGRLSAMMVTCFCPRKGLPDASSFMAWYSALLTRVLWHASSCRRHNQFRQAGVAANNDTCALHYARCTHRQREQLGLVKVDQQK